VAVVLTIVQTKQIRINIHKRNKYKKHSTNNKKHSEYKYIYYQNTHTLQNPHITQQVKTTAVHDIPKWICHNIIKYPQYKVTLMYVHGTFIPKNFTVTHFTSLKNNITSHKSCQFTSHHFTYLHSIPTWIPLLVTTFLTLYLNVFSLQGKDACKLAGNCFQLLMVLFTKEYLPAPVHCFLILHNTFRFSYLSPSTQKCIQFCLCSSILFHTSWFSSSSLRSSSVRYTLLQHQTFLT